MVNSHIQITNGLMKGFSFGKKSNQKVYALDLQKKEITEQETKKLGTKYGYFSDEIELHLNRVVEDPFGKVSLKVRDFFNSNPKNGLLRFTLGDELKVKKYIYYSIYRSEKTLEIFNQISITSRIIGEVTAEMIIRMIFNNEFEKFLDGKAVSILVNNSDYNLVLPRNCIYSIHSETESNSRCEILPISPKHAFILKPIEEHQKTLIDNGKTYNLIDSIETVKNLNRYALREELNANNQFLISHTEFELQELVKYI